MVDAGAFWLTLAAGATWMAWGSTRWREHGLALASALLLAWLDWKSLLAYSGLAALAWGIARRGGSPRRNVAMIAALAIGLAGCKWLQAASDGGVVAPLGLSYLVFRLMHVLWEAGRGGLPADISAAEFAHYVWSPAMFSAGPIERLDHFSATRIARLDGVVFAEAAQRIIVGLAKKLLVADVLVTTLQASWGVQETGGFTSADSPGKIWLGAALCYLRIYVEFSGYSDIAVGAGLLWGRRLMENFNWPVFATTPSDFWRRWHISLSSWCASYVYMPLLGSLRRNVVPLLASFLVMGLWHMIGWNRVGWAVWQTAGVLTHVAWTRLLGRPAAGNWRTRWPWRVASIVLTQGFMIASYVFAINGERESLSTALRLLGRMFGLSL